MYSGVLDQDLKRYPELKTIFWKTCKKDNLKDNPKDNQKDIGGEICIQVSWTRMQKKHFVKIFLKEYLKKICGKNNQKNLDVFRCPGPGCKQYILEK